MKASNLQTTTTAGSGRPASDGCALPFKPHWPVGLTPRRHYEVACDDKGRNGGSWMRVMIADDGDVHISMQEWEELPEGEPTPFPSIRIRTFAGGGRNVRTRQALLWLAEAMRLDAIERDGHNVPDQRTASTKS